MRGADRGSWAAALATLAAALSVLGAAVIAGAQPTPASPVVEACPRTIPGGSALSACFYKASVRASRAAGHEIMFETGKDTDLASARTYADAATSAGDAIVDIASQPGGSAALAAVNHVVVTQGAGRSARLSKGALVLTVGEVGGVEAAPSITEVEQALGRLGPGLSTVSAPAANDR